MSHSMCQYVCTYCFFTSSFSLQCKEEESTISLSTVLLMHATVVSHNLILVGLYNLHWSVYNGCYDAFNEEMSYWYIEIPQTTFQSLIFPSKHICFLLVTDLLDSGGNWKRN